jgi:hypothetical protein
VDARHYGKSNAAVAFDAPICAGSTLFKPIGKYLVSQSGSRFYRANIAGADVAYKFALIDRFAIAATVVDQHVAGRRQGSLRGAAVIAQCPKHQAGWRDADLI